MKLVKMFFILPQKLFSFSRKSIFLDFPISWRYQMRKDKTRNTFFCWTTWKVNTVLMKFGQFMSYHNKKFYQKFYKDCQLKTSSRHYCVCKEFKHSMYWKMKFLKEATCIRYLLAKSSKFVQSALRTPLIPFYKVFFEN